MVGILDDNRSLLVFFFILVYTKNSNYYEMLSLDPVPIRWMAPECVHHKKFSEASDAWAFGVLCWEVYSAGSIPYGELAPGKIVTFLAEGRRLARPGGMPDALYDLVLRTWAMNTAERPLGPELSRAIQSLRWDVCNSTSLEYTLPDVRVDLFRPPFPWQHVTLATTRQFTGQV